MRPVLAALQQVHSDTAVGTQFGLFETVRPVVLTFEQHTVWDLAEGVQQTHENHAVPHQDDICLLSLIEPVQERA